MHVARQQCATHVAVPIESMEHIMQLMYAQNALGRILKLGNDDGAKNDVFVLIAGFLTLGEMVTLRPTSRQFKQACDFLLSRVSCVNAHQLFHKHSRERTRGTAALARRMCPTATHLVLNLELVSSREKSVAEKFLTFITKRCAGFRSVSIDSCGIDGKSVADFLEPWTAAPAGAGEGGGPGRKKPRQRRQTPQERLQGIMDSLEVNTSLRNLELCSENPIVLVLVLELVKAGKLPALRSFKPSSRTISATYSEPHMQRVRNEYALGVLNYVRKSNSAQLFWERSYFGVTELINAIAAQGDGGRLGTLVLKSSDPLCKNNTGESTSGSAAAAGDAPRAKQWSHADLGAAALRAELNAERDGQAPECTCLMDFVNCAPSTKANETRIFARMQSMRDADELVLASGNALMLLRIASHMRHLKRLALQVPNLSSIVYGEVEKSKKRRLGWVKRTSIDLDECVTDRAWAAYRCAFRTLHGTQSGLHHVIFEANACQILAVLRPEWVVGGLVASCRRFAPAGASGRTIDIVARRLRPVYYRVITALMPVDRDTDQSVADDGAIRFVRMDRDAYVALVRDRFTRAVRAYADTARCSVTVTFHADEKASWRDGFGLVPCGETLFTLRIHMAAESDGDAAAE